MYIDDGASSQAQPQSIMESMSAFAQTAASGEVEVSEEGGKGLIKVIDDFQEWIDQRSFQIRTLQQRRKLGTSNGAKVMEPFLQEVVNDGQGFITQLRALRESLNKAKEGIETAMANYRRTEEANRSSFKGIET